MIFELESFQFSKTTFVIISFLHTWPFFVTPCKLSKFSLISNSAGGQSQVWSLDFYESEDLLKKTESRDWCGSCVAWLMIGPWWSHDLNTGLWLVHCGVLMPTRLQREIKQSKQDWCDINSGAEVVDSLLLIFNSISSLQSQGVQCQRGKYCHAVGNVQVTNDPDLRSVEYPRGDWVSCLHMRGRGARPIRQRCHKLESDTDTRGHQGTLGDTRRQVTLSMLVSRVTWQHTTRWHEHQTHQTPQ